MSSTLALAAATLALKNRLQLAVDRDGLNATVTSRPPDKARGNITGNQLNLFLYDLAISAAWRNAAAPRQLPGGESISASPLGLSARYLLSAYAQDDEDELAHRLLGSALLSLHDQPLLSAAELKTALPESDLWAQTEHVRITPHPISGDELSKWWTVFQAPYRPTFAYEVTVLLIDSRWPIHAALPVLKRGEDDRGIETTTGPGPSLVGVLPPEPLPAVRLGEGLTWQVDHTDSLTAQAHVQPVAGEVFAPIPLIRTAPSAPFILPISGPEWTTGLYRAWLSLPASPHPWTTNQAAFTLAPHLQVSPTTVPAGAFTLSVTCQPSLRAAQTPLLLIHGLQLPPLSRNLDGIHMTFDVPALVAGTYTVRLRVDGVDSLPVGVVDGTHAYLPTFEAAQQVEVT